MNKNNGQKLTFPKTGRKVLYLEVFNLDGYKVNKFLLVNQNNYTEKIKKYRKGYYFKFTIL